MKSGAIICICGNVPDDWTVEDELRFKTTTSNFSKVKIVTPRIMALMMNRLWLQLLSDGMTDIVIAMAEFNQKRRLQFKPNSIKLHFVGMN